MNIKLSKAFSILKILFLANILFLSGCATVHEMAVTKATEKIGFDGNGLLLMSLEIANDYKPDYQPEVIVTHVETPGANSKKDRHNYKTDLEGTVTSSSGTRYLLRMSIPPGKYVIRGASCMYRGFFILGSCFLPIHNDIHVLSNTTTYLGRVSGVIRERQKGELRAGPMIPLIDQTVTGFSSSTFDVQITDAWEEDKNTYTSIFPALKNTIIEKNIMSPFDKERAYNWWLSDGQSENNFSAGQ